MKTGIFITARLGSTRLKRKHLLEVSGKPLLQYLLMRIELAFQDEFRDNLAQIVIVTSDEPENRDFEQLTKDWISVFYGSVNNIPLRHLQAALAHGISRIIAVDGDDILCAVIGMRHVFNALENNYSYVKTSGLPFGMNSFGYSTDLLEQALVGHHDEILETGWGRVFNEFALKDISIPFCECNIPLRFTLDYPDDFVFFQSIINEIGPALINVSDEVIVNMVIDKKLYENNKDVSQEYWHNFNTAMEMEVCVNESE
jgi:spore coat polysaccharide biosynthesis protein SpsF